MSERKVLNKYYPPDYDPSKIPRKRQAKDRQYTIRTMAPFHMRCKTCGNYIYKGTKFNSRMETVQDKDYLGLRIYRFYIKCTRCVAEITFLTDPENQDYAIEHGATRNFEAQRLVDEQEKKEKEKREEEESNPMKMLEKRTKDSKREMEMMEALEDLKEMNDQKAQLHIDEVLTKRMKIHKETDEERKKREEAEIEEEIKRIKCKRIPEIKDHNDLTDVYKRLEKKMGLKNDILGQGSSKQSSAPPRKKLGIKLGIKKKVANVSTSKEASSDNKTEEKEVKSKNEEAGVAENKNDEQKVSKAATSLVGYAYSSSSEDSE